MLDTNFNIILANIIANEELKITLILGLLATLPPLAFLANGSISTYFWPTGRPVGLANSPVTLPSRVPWWATKQGALLKLQGSEILHF